MTNSGTFTVLSTFDDAKAARRAMDALAKEGFLPENMRIEPADAVAASNAAGLPAAPPRHGVARIERFFERLLGRTEHAQHARDYSRAVAGGRSVVMLDTTTEVTAERAATVMQDLGGYDLTQRREQDGAAGHSTSTAGERHLPDGTVVRWRSAQVVYRGNGEPLMHLAAD